MTLTTTQTREKWSSEKILSLAYRWINRLMWPVLAAISSLTAYWTFTLPHPHIIVQAGGGIFGLFAAICALNSMLWWSNERRNPPRKH